MNKQTDDVESAENCDQNKPVRVDCALGAEVHCARCGYLHTLPAGSCHTKISKVVVGGCENCGCTEPMPAKCFNRDGVEIKYSHYPIHDMVIVGTYNVSP